MLQNHLTVINLTMEEEEVRVHHTGKFLPMDTWMVTLTLTIIENILQKDILNLVVVVQMLIIITIQPHLAILIIKEWTI